MAYVASGVSFFAIVWAGFVLMAEGSDERGGGKARSAVVMAVVGLVLVLSAKVVALPSCGVASSPSPKGKSRRTQIERTDQTNH